MVETIQHSNLENTNLDRKVIHIYGGMEHNLVRYAKYYSCESTEISKNSEFTRKIDHNKRDFFKHW